MGFLSPSAPGPSETQVKAEKVRDRETRKEEFAAKKRQSAGFKRRQGRSLLISGDEKGVKSPTLG
jgi:hypothetical protein